VRLGTSILASLLLVAPPPARAQVAPPAAEPARDAAAVRPERAPRRQLVTPALERTAFADPRARTLLARARAARVAQDSALRAYDAHTRQRLSIALRVGRLGPQRQLMRHEEAARVRWARGAGLWVEPTARRTGFPMGGAELDLTAATPIPYFPGREALWLPFDALGRVAKSEVNENDLLHPLATGAEAYYRYATGDSVSIRLPDGSAVALRELRITARRPDWRAFVGSFWFDVARGALVRAAYRSSASVDVWRTITDDQRREIREWEERARTDTGAAARHARAEAARIRSDFGGVGAALAQGMLAPLRADLAAVTVEYGLYGGRFWLPKLHVAEGEGQGGFLRMPVRVEERFRYASVNGTDSLPPVTAPAEMGLAADDTTWSGAGGVIALGPPGAFDARRRADTVAAVRLAREDTLLERLTLRADSLRTSAAQARARGDTSEGRRLDDHAAWFASRARRITRRRETCVRDSSYVAGTHALPDGGPRMAIRLPCDPTALARSTELPGSIYDPGEEPFGSAERDALLGALGFGLQSAWAPQRPVLHVGLDLLRYNRIEGLSLGVGATSHLGRGYTAHALARLGTADLVPNGELSLARSNGRVEYRLGVFHRLGVANDDRGAPLALGASVANLLYGRDEGFYYRTWGAELGGSRAGSGPFGGATLLWRTFAERHRTAGREPNTQASLGHALGRARFTSNVEAVPLTALGVGGDLARSFGADPAGGRVDARVRAEAALTDRADSVRTSGYGRLVLDGTLARPLGPLAVALTAAAGASAGDLPTQRAFRVGGLHTVRGQFARAEGTGRVGDAFWLARGEIGLAMPVARPALFYDVGWAGPRNALSHPGRPLSGAGVGLSLLDGLVRLDVARGIRPERRWRTDLSIGARF
jgi:hypothetical protein